MLSSAVSDVTVLFIRTVTGVRSRFRVVILIFGTGERALGGRFDCFGVLWCRVIMLGLQDSGTNIVDVTILVIGTEIRGANHHS